MLKWLKISQHHHSGKIRPHEHTSYLPLGLLLLAVGVILSAYTTYAATPYDGPEHGAIGLTGVMPAKPPTIAATIDNPLNGARFSSTPITISGTCPDNTLVELFKNDIFAGSAICDEAKTYSLDIDLLIGQNTLHAKVYDALNQPGPDSTAITVYYDALPAQTSPLAFNDFSRSQILINTSSIFRGVFPGQELNVPIQILGGMPPFAVNVTWGDSNNDVFSRNDNVSFGATHVYSAAGTYQINIQVSDSSGNVAFLSVAVIVNGQPITGTSSTISTKTLQERLLVLWPLYVSSVAVVISFFIGEQREKKLLSSRGLLLPARRTL
jgi:hypothetical protein